MKLELQQEELEQLDLLLENEIKSNQDYLIDIDKDEDELRYYKGVIVEQQALKQKLEEAQIEENIVLQQLKAERENEILIDNYLSESYDRMRDDELDEELNCGLNHK